MKYPDDRKRIRQAVNNAIDRYVEDRLDADGRVEPALLRDAVLAEVPITFVPKKEARLQELRLHKWIKGRWDARRRQDGPVRSSNGDAWVWVPKAASEGGSVYQVLRPGYHIQLARASDDEIARAIRWSGQMESGWGNLRVELQELLARRQEVRPRRRKARV